MRKSSLSSLILLLLGSLLLLTNFGYLPADLWTTSFRFWPVLLILIGLEMMMTKHGSPKLVIAGILLVFALPFVVGESLPFNLNFLNFTSKASGSVVLEKKLGTLIGSQINLEMKNGDLKINSLEKHSTLFVKGDLGYSQLGKQPQVDFDPKDGLARLSIINVAGSLPVDLSTSMWSLSFSQLVPLEIRSKALGGNVNLDMSNLEVPNLSLELGKTTTTLVMPLNGGNKTTITAAEGTITIAIPEGRDALIKVPDNAAKDISTRYGRSPIGYQTENYDKAAHKVDITIEPGNAKVVIN